MNNKKQLLLSIGLVLILVLMIVGISYAAFKFTGLGNKPNTITTGAITMEYTESTNTISMTGALPTTDATGKVRLTKGEYFDFTIKSSIKGNANINWEIAAEDITPSSAKKMAGKNIKLYLTKLNGDKEEEVMAPKVYTTESTANSYTGRPSGVMSLAKGTMSASETTNYRLRMYVDEDYNPQGDGGDLSFSIKINAYGKTGDKMKTATVATKVVMDKANPEDLDYNTATNDQKKEMWTFSHEATKQTEALTDYRYIGADPNNYVKFNDELWRIIGVFDTDDGTGKVEKRLKIIRNESIGEYAWDNKDTSTGAETVYGKNEWSDARLNYLLNPGHDSETVGGSLYWNRGTGNCYYGQNNATTPCNFTANGLTDEAKAMIGNTKWYLGGTDSSNGLASHWYKYERGTTVYSGRSTNWTGKVGLMYLSDYGYATSGGSTTDRASCLANPITKWNNSSVSDCKNNDWMYKSNAWYWTMTPSSNNDYDVFYFDGTGFVYNLYAYFLGGNIIPVVHLKSTIKVIDGTGEQNNPYVLSED